MLKLAVAIGVAFGIGFFAVLAVWIERERDEAWQETIDRNLAGVWTGQRSWKPETIKLGF